MHESNGDEGVSEWVPSVEQKREQYLHAMLVLTGCVMNGWELRLLVTDPDHWEISFADGGAIGITAERSTYERAMLDLLGKTLEPDAFEAVVEGLESIGDEDDPHS